MPNAPVTGLEQVKTAVSRADPHDNFLDWREGAELLRQWARILLARSLFCNAHARVCVCVCVCVCVVTRDCKLMTSLAAQTVKLLPTMRETRARSLGREDPLEKERATHSSILAWKIPWTETRGRLQSMVLQRVGHDRVISLSVSQVLEEMMG